MVIDNGAADGQAYPHAFILGCVKSLEKPLRTIGAEPRTCIFHREAHTIVVVLFSSDDQPPGPVIDATHRIRSISQQVHNHLLKLDAVAGDERKPLRKLGV